MKAKDNSHIPTHDLESALDPIQLKNIEHKNHYDFSKQHRHSYFEVMFFEQGGGKNLVDFVEYEVKSNACYLIFPNQIHLLNRLPGSHGFLIQFPLSSVISPVLQRLLQEKAYSGFGAVMFEENEILMGRVMKQLEILALYSNSSPDFPATYQKECKQHLLQALLFDLFSMGNEKTANPAMDSDFYQFLQLIDLHYKEDQTVGFYLDRLSLSEKKLAALSQKHLGLSPLQVIHQRILLEAKRLLVTGNHAHKEIAYELGFDSPASFSAFIRKKTGLTASEIQAQVAEIHKQ